MASFIRGLPPDWRPVARAFMKDGHTVTQNKNAHLTWHAPKGKVFSGLTSNRSALRHHLKMLKSKGWDYEESENR